MALGILLRILVGVFCLFFQSSVSLANDCESLEYTTRSVHVCVCSSFYADGVVTNEKEEALRELTADLCLNYPIGAVLKDPNVFIPNGILTADASWGELQVNLETLSAEKILSLPEAELVKLFNHLGQKKVEVQWVDRHSHRNKHKVEINAAAALSFLIGIQRQSDVLSTLMAIAPDKILPLLEDRLSVLSDYHFVADTLVKMTNRLNSDNLVQIAKASAQLVGRYMSFWSQKNPKHLPLLLARLVIKMSNILNDDSVGRFDVRQRGILLGALFAGSLKFAQEIKLKDERRIWIVNTTSNLAWAATALLGIVPVASNVISAVEGIASMAFVIAAAAYTKKGPRNGVPSVKEIEGSIKLKLLDSIPPDSPAKHLDVLTLLSWMQATVQANGFAD